MDPDVHESRDGDEKVEPGALLEDCWFFGNLLNRKSRMLRSFSDPCTSSKFSQDILPGKSYEETYASIKKGDGESRRLHLISRTPSEPSSLYRQDQIPARKGSKTNRKTSSNSLVRAPSLPTSLQETQELEDEEAEFSMGKLIRQASMNYSENLPPRKHAVKALTPSPSMSRHRSRRKPEAESIKVERLEDTRPIPQHPVNQPTNKLKTQKSLTELEYEELQGFKDLGFDFDKKDLSPNVISIIPGLQEKKRSQEDEEKSARRPYLSEAWEAQNYAPSVPKWVGKKSAEGMKAQIKFWARAVASNVRQEC